MSARDEQFRVLAEQRFDGERVKIADRLRKLADQIDAIPSADSKGKRREPLAIIGEVSHTITWGIANLRTELLTVWAQDIQEAERQAKS